MNFLEKICLALLITIPAAHAADGKNYKELEDYRVLASALVASTKNVSSVADMEKMRKQTEELANDGMAIMKLYESKIPACRKQYEHFQKDYDANVMLSMTEKDVHTKYHNGTGLPEAPRFCYFGRSVVVHPILNIIRLNGAIKDKKLKSGTREGLRADFEEVVEHLEKIEANLDNPPTK